MTNLRSFVGVFMMLSAVVCSAQTSDESPSLVVATYNAMNLTGRHGIGLFPERSFARSDRDFIAIRKYLLATNADVILLQEVSDIKALGEVLPAKYSYILDPRHKIGEIGQIYTAVAFDDRRTKLTGVSVIPTGIEYVDSGVSVRVRDSLGVRLETILGPVWMFSAHLKSSCGQKGLSLGSENNPCVILEKQLRIIASYVNDIRRSGEAVIIGGDFNRRGQPDYELDAYLSIVQPKTAKPFLAKTSTRACPTFEGKDRAPIDFLLVYGMGAVSVGVTELTFHQSDIDSGFKLSDHCPVVAAFRPSSP
jgi:endonuclease/exonuclease/phosphatase family metal-dependent hydrolase